MKKISIYLLLLILVATSTISRANVAGTVKGTIVDKEDGQPLEFVSVAIYNAPEQAL